MELFLRIIAVLAVGVCIYLVVVITRSERKLVEANKRYEDLINNIQGGVITCMFDKKTKASRTLYINQGWTDLTGYTLAELNQTLGGNPQALVYPQDREAANAEYISQTAEHSNYRLQYRIMRKDGTLIWAIDRGVVTVDFHGNTQNQSIITEVSDIKEKEEELLKLAQSDPLTGLYNKTASTALATEILLQQRKGLHALMVLDIDNFKSINDSLGHALGDMVLTEVATRLRQLARPQDIVGRIGGDEFMLLITNIPEREVAQQKASDICSALRGNYICETGSCKLTCSLGVAFSEDECEFKALFINADAAMYRAKAKGRDQYLIYRKN